jgi:hypothetical protein
MRQATQRLQGNQGPSSCGKSSSARLRIFAQHVSLAFSLGFINQLVELASLGVCAHFAVLIIIRERIQQGHQTATIFKGKTVNGGLDFFNSADTPKIIWRSAGSSHHAIGPPPISAPEQSRA